MTEEICDFLSEYFGMDRNEIKEESNFVTDLGLQSYSVIEMCCQLEEKYGIEIPEEDIVNITTVKELSKYIKEKIVLVGKG